MNETDAAVTKEPVRTGANRVGRSAVVARWRYACDGRVLDVAAVRHSECGVLMGSVNAVNVCVRVGEGHRRRYRVSKAGNFALRFGSDERKSPAQLTNTVLPLV